jgi:hypothetical protein
MPLHVRPFGGEDAVHIRVAHRAVLARHLVAEHADPLRTQGLDRLLRAENLRRLRLQLVLRFQFEVAGVVPFVQLP